MGGSKRLQLQAKRWSDFRRRADYAPQNVYRHETHGWEYIPVHPFGDEPELLARLEMRPEDCRSVDAWWGIDGDATLLQSTVLGAYPGPAGQVAGLTAQATSHPERWVYLFAVFDAPFVTRVDFEAAMVGFVDAGFPRGASFQLRRGAPSLRLPRVV
ncbi:hypothetical protein ACNOYE_14210 [Nannocystaceae bacterium ST9]